VTRTIWSRTNPLTGASRGPEAVTVTFGVRSIGGTADCQSNPKYSITIFLAEPLGTR
jgi:hypothetical protein